MHEQHRSSSRSPALQPRDGGRLARPGAGTLSPPLPLCWPSHSDMAGYFLHPHCLRALVEELALEAGHGFLRFGAQRGPADS